MKEVWLWPLPCSMRLTCMVLVFPTNKSLFFSSSTTVCSTPLAQKKIHASIFHSCERVRKAELGWTLAFCLAFQLLRSATVTSSASATALDPKKQTNKQKKIFYGFTFYLIVTTTILKTNKPRTKFFRLQLYNYLKTILSSLMHDKATYFLISFLYHM